MDEQENPNIQDFFEVHYWPALDVFYAAMKKYDEAIKEEKDLADDNPAIIELHRALEEWQKQLDGLYFVQKMCEDL
ncbi:hypothetical protein LCGC14_1362660 [marine sediment metagenome]|uniref:Uncharacterized protein n=1 Tax=marine sediment metagenome TaxID=412755 RepID=A0A0F9N9U5_9ZZZZ